MAMGAIYGTDTKEVTMSAGLETLAKIRGEIDGPIAAIGGINASNIGPVIAAGAEMACVISAVGMAADPEAATRELVAIIDGRRVRLTTLGSTPLITQALSNRRNSAN